MNQLEREALIVDRAIDLLLAGGEPPATNEIEQASAIARAVGAVPVQSQAREAARSRMLAEPVDRPRRMRRWLVAIPAAAVLCAGGVAFAARNATPGDALWGLRRTAQDSRLSLVSGAAAKADATLERAAGDLSLARGLRGSRSKAREALAVFWTDLAGARRAIAVLPDAERRPREGRADALESDATTLEDALASEGLLEGEGHSSLDDRSDGRHAEVEDRSGSDGERSGSGDGSGDGSGSGEVSGSGDTSGSGETATSGETSGGTSTSGETSGGTSTSGETSGGTSGGSGDTEHSPSPSPSPTASSGSDGGSGSH